MKNKFHEIYNLDRKNFQYLKNFSNNRKVTKYKI